MIRINLALARSVDYDHRTIKYDCKECYKLKRNLRLYKTFIEEAKGFKGFYIQWPL
jgi:hypothetical protein